MDSNELQYKQDSQFASPWTLRQRIGMFLWDYCWFILCKWTPKPLNLWRLIVLRVFGAKIYGRPFVHQRARIQIPWNLTLMHRSAIGDRANIYSLGYIVIHENATVAQEVYLCTGTHAFDLANKNLITKPIVVESGAFIGARSFVLPGITIGSNAIVGACSVVTKSVKCGKIVKGNPAK